MAYTMALRLIIKVSSSRILETYREMATSTHQVQALNPLCERLRRLGGGTAPRCLTSRLSVVFEQEIQDFSDFDFKMIKTCRNHSKIALKQRQVEKY